MQPSGKPEAVAAVDRPVLRRRRRRRGRRRCCGSAGRTSTSRPATAHYTITDSYVLPVDVEVEAVQPHAHYRARDVRGEATLPDGSTRALIHIARLGFPLAARLPLRHAASAAEGHDAVDASTRYDNSAANARNPERPPKRARWGQRSSDEMGDLWIQVLTRDEPRPRSL